MSIESDRKSDIYDRMLEENSYTPNHAILWNRNSVEQKNDLQYNEQRLSLEE